MNCQRVLLSLCFLLLTSCGFHMRGAPSHPAPTWLQNVSIIGADRDLYALLKADFKAYHIAEDACPTTANYLLTINQESMQQNIKSVSSSASPRQYQLIYSLRFTLQTTKGQEIIPATPIIITRLLTVNNDRILGSDDEAYIMKKEMKREGAWRIMNRLAHNI